jgi:hypothetical protein
MHLSKKVLYIGIIAYSAALLIFQDYGPMPAAASIVSLMWLCKMFVDIVFAGMAFIRLAGPTLFASEDDDDEVAIHEEDLHFSDSALFGLFLVNVLGNGALHAYYTVQTTDAVSFYFSLWTIAEAIILFFTVILFKHASASQRKAARKARAAAQDAGPKPVRNRDAA